jgi:hypothetical protein
LLQQTTTPTATMLASTPITFALFLFSTLAAADVTSQQKIGWTGTITNTDGGLGGTVTVVDAKTLKITDYTLEDASAPALYWWGSTSDVLKDGFRISDEQVTMAAETDSLTISLDAGKTTADFSTVGLWCERLSANFGQASLKASGAGSATPSASSNPTTAGTAASPTNSKGAAVIIGGSARAVIGGVMAAVFAALMV